MNIQDRLRHCAKHTGLDAVVELLNEAATHIEGLNPTPKLQGDPSWWMRETDEGAEWTDTAPLVLSGWTPLYTTPQPAKATQTEVTDAGIEQVLALAHSYADAKLMRYGALGIKEPPDPAAAFVELRRAILSLRPAAVSMTEEEIVHAYCGCNVNDAPAGVWFEAGARAAEKHHFGTNLKDQA